MTASISTMQKGGSEPIKVRTNTHTQHEIHHAPLCVKAKAALTKLHCESSLKLSRYNDFKNNQVVLYG